MVNIKFINSKSEELFLLKEHALFGISPFNSYYSEENLKKLFAWGLSYFKEVSIFIPDKISAYTLQAKGYSEDKAQKKTRLHDNNLKNKSIRALVANNLSEAEAKNKIILWTDLMNNQTYLELYNTCKSLYEKDEKFKNGCLETSKWVLTSKDVCETVGNEAINIAAKYFIAELPIYLNSPDIFNVSSSLVIYKELLPDFLSKIYNNQSEFSNLLSSKQGYLAVYFNE
jgi:cyclo(L-tyrosyl-L-tyrosyl) synthase